MRDTAQSNRTTRGINAPIDETFTLDIYNGDAVITSKITNPEAIDGLVFTTSKTVTGDAQTTELTGTFDNEDMTLVLYKGKFKVTADNLARGTAGDIDQATHEVTTKAVMQKLDATAEIQLKSNGSTLAELTGVDIKFYSDSGYTTPLTDDKATIGDYGYFMVIATGVDDHTAIKADSGLNANTFATQTVALCEVVYNFSFKATALEEDKA